ncbi:Enoyl-CoA hydratase/carnithine racemase [Lentibacillus persicus]|uniref:Enoyl-CoA hydratase/carnithine racemase n=1 Tax=Lentibacillus persicus TaxID=640948 RepID=A0A1I1SFW2_9BACI|nr:enoyl-CoA hydratase [Lentibacillus persicus]SFD43528.1 Enoyl-CoA hydratase/carnithine racemase [Lentibacillus persicus]
MAELLSVTKENGVATVIIDNPPMNVLSVQVTKELDEVFQALKDDPKVITVILTGAGERAFMAGADIKEFPDKEKNKSTEIDTHDVFDRIENISKPVIAVLNGFALGGGLELSLLADIRIAEEHAQLGLPEVNLGLLPGAGGTQRLPRIVGASKAKEMMFTGDPLSAEEAHRLGLVNKIVPKGEGRDAANSLAQKLANHSLQSLSRIKHLVNVGSELPIDEGQDMEKQLFDDLFVTEDAKEGVRAFIEKRKPVFTHK